MKIEHGMNGIQRFDRQQILLPCKVMHAAHKENIKIWSEK
jgi:hypothetical protein